MPLKHMPTLAGAMTPFPYSIDVGEDVAAARTMMTEHDIRHLPVTRDHAIVGIISDRDVLLSRTLSTGEPPSVESLCTRDPYLVDLRTRLDDVVLGMAERHVDSAIVTRQGKLAGILTSRDACRVLAAVLRELYPPPTDGNVA